MNEEDIKISVIRQKLGQIQTSHIRGSFVKIEHIPSGIAVTKYGERGQHKIKEIVLKEIIELVKVWNNQQ